MKLIDMLARSTDTEHYAGDEGLQLYRLYSSRGGRVNRIPIGLIEVKISESIILLPEVMYASH